MNSRRQILMSTLALGLMASLTACPPEATVSGKDAGNMHDAASSVDSNTGDAGIIDHQNPADGAGSQDSAIDDANMSDAMLNDATEDDSAVDSDANIATDAAVNDAVSDDAGLEEDAGSSQIIDATELCKVYLQGFMRIAITLEETNSHKCEPGAIMHWEGMPGEASPADFAAEKCVAGNEVYEIINDAYVAGHLHVNDNFQTCRDQGIAFRNSHTTVEAYLQDAQEDPDSIGQSCADLITGTVEANGLCAIDWECADDLYCDYQDSDNSFRCLQAASVGNPCRESIAESLVRHCEAGLSCVNNFCVQSVGENQACSSSTPCNEGLYCKNDICTAYASDGESCTDINCAVGLYCRSSDHICRGPEAIGTTCVPSETICAGDCSVCRKNASTATEYQCLSLATENEYCDNNDACLPTLYCDSAHHSVAKKEENSACSEDYECQHDLLCKNSVCSVKNCQDRSNCAAGDACMNNSDCIDGLACHPSLNQCVSKPGLNQSCDVISQCDNDTYCNDSSICVAKKPAGESCDEDIVCASNHCNTDQHLCTPETGGCIFEKSNFGLFVFFGLIFAPMRRRRAKNKTVNS